MISIANTTPYLARKMTLGLYSVTYLTPQRRLTERELFQGKKGHMSSRYQAGWPVRPSARRLFGVPDTGIPQNQEHTDAIRWPI